LTTQVIEAEIEVVQGLKLTGDLRDDTNEVLSSIQKWFLLKGLNLVAIQQIQVLKKNNRTTKTYRYNVVLSNSSHKLSISEFVTKVDCVFNVVKVKLK